MRMRREITGEARSGTPVEPLSKEADKAFCLWWLVEFDETLDRHEAKSRSLVAT